MNQFLLHPKRNWLQPNCILTVIVWSKSLWKYFKESGFYSADSKICKKKTITKMLNMSLQVDRRNFLTIFGVVILLGHFKCPVLGVIIYNYLLLLSEQPNLLLVLAFIVHCGTIGDFVGPEKQGFFY